MRVFISYRRDDSAAYLVPYLREDLETSVGPGNVFLDIDSIPLGADFRSHIHRSIQRADVVLVLIGPQWLQGRLFEPHDPVVTEIVCAEELGKHLIPVLIGGVTMPAERDLPPEIDFLPRRNAASIARPPGHKADLARLREYLSKLEPNLPDEVSVSQRPSATHSSTPTAPVKETPRPRTINPGRATPNQRRVVIAVGFVAIAVSALLLVKSLRADTTSSKGSTTSLLQSSTVPSAATTITSLTTGATATAPASKANPPKASNAVEPEDLACDPLPVPNVCIRGFGRTNTGTITVRLETVGFDALLAPGHYHVHIYENTPELAAHPERAGHPSSPENWVIPTYSSSRKFIQQLTERIQDLKARGAAEICALTADAEHRVVLNTGNCRQVSTLAGDST
jgi:TIR domain